VAPQQGKPEDRHHPNALEGWSNSNGTKAYRSNDMPKAFSNAI